MEKKDAKLLNGLALAYMGDGIYELYIRHYLLEQGDTKPNKLHQKATKYVSAKAQARLIQKMVDETIITEEEVNYYKRGRNAKSHTKAKSVDISTYNKSTGFEALFGYLYLTAEQERLEELVQWCIQEINLHEEEKGERR